MLPRNMISPMVCAVGRHFGACVSGSSTVMPSCRTYRTPCRPLRRVCSGRLSPAQLSRLTATAAGPVDLGQPVDVRDVEADLGHALDHRGRRRGAGDHAAHRLVDAFAQLGWRRDQQVVHDRRGAVMVDAVLAHRSRGSPARRPGAGRRACRRASRSSTGSTNRCNGTSAASTDNAGSAASSMSTALQTALR